ncbi:hypothetical protein PR048_018495 [Dryococelus australis]|uniref:Uncharacterized protein n=1 Tax=Dryococelus australis TaxID=614101 RepID=A0ABQ9HCM4_9NEOP|nr:hypothetical protein PR048_018495 [Dryococelus australis]
MHHLVHVENRFDLILFNLLFPSIVTHGSRIPHLGQKSATVEIPENWVNIFRTARSKPSLFNVEEVQKEIAKYWLYFLDEKYRSKKTYNSSVWPTKSMPLEVRIHTSVPLCFSKYEKSAKCTQIYLLRTASPLVYKAGESGSMTQSLTIPEAESPSKALPNGRFVSDVRHRILPALRASTAGTANEMPHYGIKPHVLQSETLNDVALKPRGATYVPGESPSMPFVCESTKHQQWLLEVRDEQVAYKP